MALTTLELIIVYVSLTMAFFFHGIPPLGTGSVIKVPVRKLNAVKGV